MTSATQPKANPQQAMEMARDALEQVVWRLQMDIDDGGRPTKWAMEHLVRKAAPAIDALTAALSQQAPATPAQAPTARMLTSEELYPCESAFGSIPVAAIRKFCEVNGIRLASDAPAAAPSEGD